MAAFLQHLPGGLLNDSNRSANFIFIFFIISINDMPVIQYLPHDPPCRRQDPFYYHGLTLTDK